MIGTLVSIVIVLLVVALIVYVLLRWIERHNWLYSRDETNTPEPEEPESTV